MKKFKTMLSVFMVILIISISIAPSFALGIESLNRNVIDENLTLVMDKQSNDEKIPVYIWYNDISQTDINNKVEEKTGLTEKTISTDILMPDDILLSQLKEGSHEAQKNMTAYLSKTEPLRRREKQNTDEYINTRREFSRKAYTEKSNQIKDIADIENSNIIFDSKYAPFIICELSKSQINKLNKDIRIEEIGYYEEAPLEDYSFSYTDVTLNNMVVDDLGLTDEGIKVSMVEDDETEYTPFLYTSITLNHNKVVDDLGLTGDGIKVGMVENGVPDEHDDLPEGSVNYVGQEHTKDSHATGTARVLKGTTNGFAKDIDLYSAHCTFENIEQLITMGIQIINCSSGWVIFEDDYTTRYAYSKYDKWFDHIASIHSLTVVVSAGNTGSNDGEWYTWDDGRKSLQRRIIAPGMAHNVITVGSYRDGYTHNNLNDDQLNNNSSHKNYNGTDASQGVKKPDVVMPCTSLVDNGGTSYAAPILTALIAQMFELKPSLAASPEAVKAIVLASCHRKVKPSANGEDLETMSQGITERQGAGAPDAWTMAGIVCQGTYGYGFFTAPEQYINFVQPKYGATGLNISVAWLRENTDTDPDNIDSDANDITAGRATNVNLYVYQNDSLVKSSDLSHSSTEMCYLDNLTTDYKYKIKLTQTYPPTKIRYGYAWSTNNMYAPISTNQDSINYIRSANGEKYLAYNTSSQTPSAKIYTVSSQSTFNDAYYWILEKTDNAYNISTGYGNTKLYLGQSSTQNDTSYESQLGTVAQNINILYNGDGTVSFLNSTRDRILTSHSDGTVCWNDFDENTSTPIPKQKFYFDKVNYLCGDANMDGDLGTDDTNTSVGQDQLFIQNYTFNPTTLSNIQFYLSDMDKDGVISIMDASMAGYLAMNKYI